MVGIILCVDDWEGLYVDGELISEGHNLSEPNDWIRWTREFDLEGIKYIYLEDEDYDYVADSGSMLSNLSDYKGNYK